MISSDSSGNKAAIRKVKNESTGDTFFYVLTGT